MKDRLVTKNSCNVEMCFMGVSKPLEYVITPSVNRHIIL